MPVMFPHEQFNVHTLDTEVLVLALDSLQARRTIWESLKLCWQDTDVRLLIDLRSGLDLITIYTVDLRQDEPYTEYEGSFSRGSLNIPCSARAVAYNSSTCAGLAAAIVRAWVMRDPLPRRIIVDHKTWFLMASGMTGDTEEV